MVHDGVVHLVDDDDAVRQSLAFLLTTAGYAVRVYASAALLLNQSESLQPGCILTDIRMPEMDGLELQRILNERKTGLPVIVMTGHGDVPLAVAAMKAGALDFLEKPFAEDVLLEVIGKALDRHRTTSRHNNEKAAVGVRLARLSERERQVLDGLAAGHPNKTIAYDLNISVRTVEVHRANVMNKMGANNLSALLQMMFIAEADAIDHMVSGGST